MSLPFDADLMEKFNTAMPSEAASLNLISLKDLISVE